MKVLLISNDEKNISAIKDFLNLKGYSAIIYTNFLKALDNLEEISPDFCIINVLNYPRHWKILCQFLKSKLFLENCSVILFAPNNFSEEELKKTQILGVKGIFKSDDKIGLNSLLNILEPKPQDSLEKKRSLLAKIEALNNEKR